MNHAISDLSQIHDFYVNDLYALVEGNPDLYSQDGRHMSEGGYTLLGNQVADVLEGFCDKTEKIPDEIGGQERS